MPKPAAIADACGRVLRRSVPALVGARRCVAAVGGTAWAGYRFVTTSPRFAITTIEVHGNRHLSDDQIRRRAARARRRQRVRDRPRRPRRASCAPTRGSRRADARRVLPHTIVIDVREHVPAAIVELGGLYLVDASGHPFKRAELGADDGAGLPIITGLDRTTYVADPDATAGADPRARSPRSPPGATTASGPSIGEVHLDPHGALTLRHLRPRDRDPARHARTPRCPRACRRSTPRGPSSPTAERDARPRDPSRRAPRPSHRRLRTRTQ